MSVNYVRSLTSSQRTTLANLHLGMALAFVAGAINAGGFLAVQQYTSHMTGIVSSMADNFALGTYTLVLSGAGSVLSFLLGAACCAIMINYSHRKSMHSKFALPLLLEAVLLLGFGLLGARLSTVQGLFVPATVMLLCFIMGLQNAVITKLSNSVIRTTHITGIVTDIGIELGKLCYYNTPQTPAQPKVMADRRRLSALSLLALSFLLGGVVGALGFKHAGYLSTIPLALILVSLAIVPTADDIARLWRRSRLK